MLSIKSYIEALGIHVSPALSEQLQRFERRIFAKGEHLVREGQVATSITLVLRGKVRHYYNIEGKDYTRWVTLPGNLTLAFKSFVCQSPSAATLECIEDVEVLWMGRDDFYRLQDEFAAIGQLWTRCLEREMVRYEDRVTELITSDSTERYLDFMDRYPLHAQEVPLKYIASMLGIEPRHLSRIRRNLMTHR